MSVDNKDNTADDATELTTEGLDTVTGGTDEIIVVPPGYKLVDASGYPCPIGTPGARLVRDTMGGH